MGKRTAGFSSKNGTTTQEKIETGSHRFYVIEIKRNEHVRKILLP
jgi:hypothetical protein